MMNFFESAVENVGVVGTVAVWFVGLCGLAAVVCFIGALISLHNENAYGRDCFINASRVLCLVGFVVILVLMFAIPARTNEFVCAQCEAKFEPGDAYCSSCGYEVSDSRFCAECGDQIDEGDKFCGECGTKVKE